MNYIDFFNKLKCSDSRVEYIVLDQEQGTLDSNIPMFYRFVNPINVEFEFGDGIIRLIPFSELETTNKQYEYVNEGCIFATCNGEPIYEKNQKVYTRMCGKNRIIEEEIAISIDSLFEKVNENI